VHILIADDNKEIVLGLKKLLEENGFDVTAAHTLSQARASLDTQNFDLIVLDWLFPDGSGVSFLQEERRLQLKTPVLMLSSKSEAADKAEALDAGADDYMHKPFSHIEFMARVRALLRREGTQKQTKVTIDNLCVDFATRAVTVDGEAIKLSKKEFELLELLVINANIVLTRYQISEHLNREFDALKTSNIVDAHIKNLRKKLGAAASLIETVRGVGFTIKTI